MLCTCHIHMGIGGSSLFWRNPTSSKQPRCARILQPHQFSHNTIYNCHIITKLATISLNKSCHNHSINYMNKNFNWYKYNAKYYDQIDADGIPYVKC